MGCTASTPIGGVEKFSSGKSNSTETVRDSGSFRNADDSTYEGAYIDVIEELTVENLQETIRRRKSGSNAVAGRAVDASRVDELETARAANDISPAAFGINGECLLAAVDEQAPMLTANKVSETDTSSSWPPILKPSALLPMAESDELGQKPHTTAFENAPEPTRESKQDTLAAFMKLHRKSKRATALAQMSKRGLFKRESTKKKGMSCKKKSIATSSSLTPLEMSLHTGDYSGEADVLGDLNAGEKLSPIQESPLASPSSASPLVLNKGFRGKLSTFSASDDEEDPLYHKAMDQIEISFTYPRGEGIGLLLMSRDVSEGSSKVVRLVVKGHRTKPDGSLCAAGKAGVTAGDIIETVNGVQVSTMNDITDILKEQKNPSVSLQLYRQRTEMQ